jgi:hypothetical protein
VAGRQWRLRPLAELWLDGVLAYSFAPGHGGFRLDVLRLGAISGIDANTRGVHYVDDVYSARNDAEGPLPPPE